MLAFLMMLSLNPVMAQEPSEGSSKSLLGPFFQWQQSLPTEKNVALAEYGSPLIMGDKVFLGAVMENGLLVFERSSGLLIGRIDSPAPVQARPILIEDQLLISDKAGNVTRYDTVSDNVVWTKSTGAPIVSAPQISGDALYVSTVDDVMYCLSLADGSLKWRYAHKADPSRKGKLTILAAPTPTIANGVVFAGFSDGAVVSLKESTGEVIQASWIGEGRYPDIASSVAVAGDIIYVSGFDKPFVAMKSDMSATLWSKDIGASSESYIDGTRLYHPGSDGVLRVFDIMTGDEIWSWDSGHRAALSKPIPINGSLLTGSSAHGLTLLDINTGNVLWQTPIDMPLDGIVGLPAVSQNQIIALSSAGNLVAFEFKAPDPMGLGCPKLFCEWDSDE